jgi:tRNA modification GTPase
MLIADTIAAVATPPGEGGIAIVRVSGPDALAVAGAVFRPSRTGDSRLYRGYSVHYGRFLEPETLATVDDGLLTVFVAPQSYTGEDAIELSCHGGMSTAARVLRCVLAAGARTAEPGEFTQRAFMNGRLDLAQAEAVADLIRARTDAAQRVARRQLDGALSKAVREQRDALIGILAAIEVTIDFSEEVGDLDYGPLAARITAVRRAVEALLATADRGRLLREGLRAALIGRPNVGKSSLLNALLGADRAIVTAVPGTTRDLIEESVSVCGIPVVLVDAAGLRETEDAVERIGVERAESALRDCDVALFVLDAAEGVTPADRVIADRLRKTSGPRILTVLNKWDAAPAAAAADLQATTRALLPGSELAAVSALTGFGVEALRCALPAAAPGGNGTGEIGAESVIVSSARHHEALRAAWNSLCEAEHTTEQRLPGDFIAIDARGALDALGLITGETVTDDIVHRIFRDFCVGK